MAGKMYQADTTPNQLKAPDAVTPDESTEVAEHTTWLQIARDAFTTSESYFDASVRKEIERNLAHFQNRHAPGSKYYSEAYKYRARGFRPKTRSVIRKNEAAAAKALFSTSDVVHVAAEDDGNLISRVSAEINQELLQYRLENTIPWFQIAVGAYQETLTSKIVVSHQRWNFEEQISYEPLYDEQGNTVLDEEGEAAYEEQRTVVHDTPAIELRPVENVRFSVAADWTNPVATSSYLIDMLPMTIGDAKAWVTQKSNHSEIPWLPISDEMWVQGKTSEYDPIRAQRDGQGRQDTKDQQHATTDFDTIWIHRNIVKKDGRDWLYYTLGTAAMLSEPIPLEWEYKHLAPGERPYVLGTSTIEAHRQYPACLADITGPLQQEANDINNQRRDNVTQVLNRRYYVDRNANVDYQSLLRSVPGGITLTDRIDAIKENAIHDITGSAYAEQDRINMDYDEVAGNFSTSSVASNRKLNETVGGMELLDGDANELVEYQLRVFVETWCEPVLKQIIKLEQRHETDEALLSLMGEKVRLWQRYGVNRVVDKMIQGSMNVKLNVGFGSTNPHQRIQKLSLGLGTIANFAPQIFARMDADEVATEVLGALGYKSVDRFFPQPDENTPQPQQQEDPQVAIQKMRTRAQLVIEQAKMQNADQERQARLQEAQLNMQAQLIKMANDKGVSLEKLKAQIGLAAMKEKGANERLMVERNFAINEGGGRGL